MANPTSEIIGIIVSGAIAGVVLIVVFVIIAVYCYRAMDRSDNKKVLMSKRNLRYVDNAGYLAEPAYYGDATSSVGTGTHLMPPYPIPMMVGAPARHPGEGYHSGPTTLDKKKRKKGKRRSFQTDELILGYEDDMFNAAYANYQHTRPASYDEREDHMDFEEENQENTETALKEDYPGSVPIPLPDDEEPVIVTYLEAPKDLSQETEVKTVPNDMEGRIPPPPPPPLPVLKGETMADPDNGERTPSVTSDPEEGSEAYHRRQREPPKGDIGPPNDYQVSRL